MESEELIGVNLEPKKNRKGSLLRKAFVVGSAAILTPIAVSNEKAENRDLITTDTIRVETTNFPQQPSFVADHLMEKGITFEGTLADTNVPAIKNDSVGTTIDTLKTEIAHTYSTAQTESVPVKNIESKKVELGIDTVQTIFSTIINDAIQASEKKIVYDKHGKEKKKDTKTTFHSLLIQIQGDTLEYTTVLKAKNKYLFFSLDIKITGGIVQQGDTLILSGPVIHALTDDIVKQAEAEILPIWPTIVPKFREAVSARLGGKKIAKLQAGKSGVIVTLEPEK